MVTATEQKWAGAPPGRGQLLRAGRHQRARAGRPATGPPGAGRRALVGAAAAERGRPGGAASARRPPGGAPRRGTGASLADARVAREPGRAAGRRCGAGRAAAAPGSRSGPAARPVAGRLTAGRARSPLRYPPTRRPGWPPGRRTGYAAARLSPAAGRRVPLPGYPFQRDRHWIEPPDAAWPTGTPAMNRAERPDRDREGRPMAPAAPWFVSLRRPADAGPLLLCLPPAGAGAEQLPGLAGRAAGRAWNSRCWRCPAGRRRITEPPAFDLDELVEAVAAAGRPAVRDVRAQHGRPARLRGGPRAAPPG